MAYRKEIDGPIKYFGIKDTYILSFQPAAKMLHIFII